MTVLAAEEAAGAASSARAAKGARAIKAPGAPRRRPPVRGSGSTPATLPERTPTTEAASPAPAPTSSGAGAGPSIVMPAAVSSGSGFLLGVFAWALGLAYIRGGAPEVRRFMAAKFFNKTEG